jgi:hypothetical protein
MVHLLTHNEDKSQIKREMGIFDRGGEGLETVECNLNYRIPNYG